MSYLDRDTYGMYKNQKGPGPRLMGANTFVGDDVYNHQGEKLGDIKEVMLDVPNGRIAYAVLAYGGVFSIGEKLFAVPWSALRLDTENKRFLLDVTKDRIKDAPGFDKGDWPDMVNPSWTQSVNAYYGTRNYIEDLPR